MLRNRRMTWMWMVCSLFTLGCDPVRTTVQMVRLQVSDSASRQQPVVGAQLLLKRLWDRAEFPWFRGATDEDGKAYIVVEYTVVDRSRKSKPPAWRDGVTEKEFLVQVRKEQTPNAEEKMTLFVQPGESARGSTVMVTVLEILEPRYVDQITGWPATTIVLWLFVLNLGIAFGAGLYESRIVVPQWFEFSGDTGLRWNAVAARKADVGRRFWVFITTVPLTLLTLASLVVLWLTPESVYQWRTRI